MLDALQRIKKRDSLFRDNTFKPPIILRITEVLLNNVLGFAYRSLQLIVVLDKENAFRTKSIARFRKERIADTLRKITRGLLALWNERFGERQAVSHCQLKTRPLISHCPRHTRRPAQRF